MDLPHLNVRGLSLGWATPRLRATLRGINKFSKYVGLDAPQQTVADAAGEVRYLGEIVTAPEAIAKLVDSSNGAQDGLRSATKPAPVATPFADSWVSSSRTTRSWHRR
jgi:hypothetical protein